MVAKSSLADFWLELTGRIVDVAEIELKIRELTRILETREGTVQGGSPEEDLDREDASLAANLEAVPEDARVWSQELSSAELISKLERNQAVRKDHLSHLHNSYDEVFRCSVGYSYSSADGSSVLNHCHGLISWLTVNRRFFISLAAHRAVLEKEMALECDTERTGGGFELNTVMDNSCHLADLEKRVKGLWQLQTKFRGRPAQRDHLSKVAMSSNLLAFKKALENVQLIKQQSAAFLKYSSPVVVQVKLSDDLASRLSEIQSGLLGLQAAYLACNDEIVALTEGFESAMTTVPPKLSSPQSMHSISIGQSDFESAVNSIVREAFEQMRQEHLKQIFEDIPSGNENPNQQYAWKLLQTTFLIMDGETRTTAFKRADPDLSGPRFSILY